MFFPGSDAIIRQHKAACLRITALLICKDLLWVGTSAGVVLTLPVPKVTSSTSSVADIPSVTGSGQGHTGHVRFLTFVDVPVATSNNPAEIARQRKHSEHSAPTTLKGLNLEQQRRQSLPGAMQSAMMVISGGDGYEDFSATAPNEAAGKEDSTNHLLLWQV